MSSTSRLNDALTFPAGVELLRWLAGSSRGGAAVAAAASPGGADDTLVSTQLPTSIGSRTVSHTPTIRRITPMDKASAEAVSDHLNLGMWLSGSARHRCCAG